MNHYQLIVIGAGPGGYVAALRAAKLGLHTAVVEDREAGGTCLNRGCVPTKSLLHSSQVLRDAREGAAVGVLAENIRADLPAMFARQKEISAKLSAGVEGLFKSAKVDFLQGRGCVTAPGCVQVSGKNGETASYTADHIIIATGSVPARPPIPGLDLPGVMTSDELLHGAEEPYRSIVIIGGGVIGVEFATFYGDLGCQVTIVEGLDRLLPNLDRELGQNLAQLLKKQGVTIHTGAMVQRVEQNGEELSVCFTAKGEEHSVTGQAVLCAIGRRPYWEGVFAPDLQPETVGRAIKVDENFCTSIPGVYAIGDVSSRIQLAHVASAQGVACVEKICGKVPAVDLRVVPSCVYCRPEIASVGLTEAEAKDAGIPVKVGKCVMGANARTMIDDPGRCFMKVVGRVDTRQIVGAQLMCQHSTDMIDQLSQAVANGMTVEQLLRAMRPHPTFAEALGDALEDLAAKLDK